MRRTFLCAVAVLSVNAAALAHLCNNIYRTPDRVVVKPEKPVAAVDRSDEFRVFVQNNYPTYLHNVRLAAKVDGEGVTVGVTPEAVEVLKAGERTAFTVRITVQEGAEKGQRPLTFSVSANEIGFRPVEEVSTEVLREQLPAPSNYGNNILAAETLARRKDPVGTKWLIDFMANARVERDYRSRAIRALGTARRKETAPALKKMLEEQDGFLKGNALLALGCLKAEPETLRAFVQDRDEFVQACALAGLALAGDQDMLPRLQEGLKSENVYVRIACGWGLAAHRDKEGVAALDRAFQTEDAMQRVMAGDALVDVANRPATEEESATTSQQSARTLADSSAAAPFPPASAGQKPRPAYHRRGYGYGLALASALVIAAGLFRRRHRHAGRD
jgi:hypothetical protein